MRPIFVVLATLVVVFSACGADRPQPVGIANLATPTPTVLSTPVPTPAVLILTDECSDGTRSFKWEFRFSYGYGRTFPETGRTLVGFFLEGCFTDRAILAKDRLRLDLQLTINLAQREQWQPDESEKDFVAFATADFSHLIWRHMQPSLTLVVNGESTGESLWLIPIYAPDKNPIM